MVIPPRIYEYKVGQDRLIIEWFLSKTNSAISWKKQATLQWDDDDVC